jgi:hypothetical protein
MRGAPLLLFVGALVTTTACPRTRPMLPASLTRPPTPGASGAGSALVSATSTQAAPILDDAQRPSMFVVEGLEGITSAIHVARGDVCLVAGSTGDPHTHSGAGYVARVTPDGLVENRTFIAGGRGGVTLDAPRGLLVVDERLFVADVDTLRVFHVDTGAPLDAITIAGTTRLDALALMPGGGLVVSDAATSTRGPTGRDALYRVSTDRVVSTLFASPTLAHPSGLLGGTDFVDVVTGGAAGLLRIGADGVVRGTRTAPRGGLDGLVALPDGRRAFSSRDAGAVYVIDAAYAISPLLFGVEAPGDLGVDPERRRLLVPLTTRGSLLVRTL